MAGDLNLDRDGFARDADNIRGDFQRAMAYLAHDQNPPVEPPSAAVERSVPSHTCKDRPESSTGHTGRNPDQDGRERIVHTRPSNYATDRAAFLATERIAMGIRAQAKPLLCPICGKPIVGRVFAHYDTHTWWQKLLTPVLARWHRRKRRRLQKGRS